MQQNLYNVRDEFLNKSTTVYVLFYTLLSFATFLSAIAQFLIYEERKVSSDLAGKLDVYAAILNTISLLIMQILSISSMRAIGKCLNDIGRLLNTYLSPIITQEEREDLRTEIITLLKNTETFWVSMPQFEFQKNEVTRGSRKGKLQILNR